MQAFTRHDSTPKDDINLSFWNKVKRFCTKVQRYNTILLMNYLRNVQFFSFWIPFFFPFFFYMHRDNKVWSARHTTLLLIIYIYIYILSFHFIRPFSIFSFSFLFFTFIYSYLFPFLPLIRLQSSLSPLSLAYIIRYIIRHYNLQGLSWFRG